MTTSTPLIQQQIASLPGFNKKTTLLIDISQAFHILWTIGSFMTEAGSISASIITYILFPLYLGYALLTKNKLLLKLIIFGTSCGFLELFADHYAVVTLDSLVYPLDEPMLWTSPLYMPFAWSNVLVQMTYLGLRLSKWKGIAFATAFLSVGGGAYVFFFENMAKGAGWWYYHNASMLFNTPYYISLAEILLFITIPASTLFIAKKKGYHWSAIIGGLSGIWILIAAIIAYALVP